MFRYKGINQPVLTTVAILISVLKKDTFNFTFWNWNLVHLALFLTFHYQHHLQHITRGLGKTKVEKVNTVLKRTPHCTKRSPSDDGKYSAMLSITSIVRYKMRTSPSRRAPISHKRGPDDRIKIVCKYTFHGRNAITWFKSSQSWWYNWQRFS
jgi:hypothetical protein